MTADDKVLRSAQDDRPVWPYALVIPLVLAAMHWPVLSGRAIYFHNDLWQWFLPVHDYLRRELWAGNRLPWCPLIGCGYPLAAEPQIGIWYPLNLLLAIPLPIGLMMGWLLWLHYVIAGLGVFALARLLRLPPLGAMVAAVIFSTTGFMIAHLHHVAIITAVAWFPWAWYGLLAYRTRGRNSAWGRVSSRGQEACAREDTRAHASRYLMLIAWCSAAQLLAGQPQVWLLTFVSGFVMLALAEGLLRDAPLQLPRETRLRDWSFLIITVGLGVGLAGVTLLPMLSLYALSERMASDFGFVTSYCLSRESLKTLLGIRLQIPTYWEFEAFAGLGTLVLGLIALVRGRQRAALYLFCTLILFALFMGLAQVNPIYRLFPYIPLLSGMRCAGRWVLVVSICLSLLAAYGLQALGRRRWLMWLAAAMVIGEVAWFGARYNPRASPELLEAPEYAQSLQAGRLVTMFPQKLLEDATLRDEFVLGRQLIVPNLNMVWNVPTVELYMPLQLRHFAEFRNSVNWLDPRASRDGGVRWLLTRETSGWESRGWRPAQAYRDVRLYERRWTQGWLRPRPDNSGPLRSKGRAEVAVATAESSRGVQAHVSTPHSGYLVVNYAWLPWWQATVNGQPAQVERTDLAFCAVPVPEGTSQIELRYRQPRLREGVVVTAVSLLLLAVLLLLDRRRRP